MPRKGSQDYARELIRLSFGEAGLQQFGHYPLFVALGYAFDRSHQLPHDQRPILTLAEDALWRAVTEWLAGRDFPVRSARETIADAKSESFDLVQRATELLLPRRFLR